MKRLAILVLSLGLFVSCGESPGKVEKRAFEPNPTSYIFAKPIADLRKDILATLDNFEVMRPFYASFAPEGGYYFSARTKADGSAASNGVLDDPAAANDIYLQAYGAVIGPSPVYSVRGKPLPYTSEFHLHFESVDEKNTRVTVIPHNPRVANGSKCCSPHGLYTIYQDVEPTTIEEYRILQLIGQVVGTKDMPPLKLPADK
jgi:hypothetical protein